MGINEVGCQVFTITVLPRDLNSNTMQSDFLAQKWLCVCFVLFCSFILRELHSLLGLLVGYKVSRLGTSLAVQWLRLCTSSAAGAGSIPGWGTKIPHAAAWCDQK